MPPCYPWYRDVFGTVQLVQAISAGMCVCMSGSQVSRHVVVVAREAVVLVVVRAAVPATSTQKKKTIYTARR